MLVKLPNFSLVGAMKHLAKTPSYNEMKVNYEGEIDNYR